MFWGLIQVFWEKRANCRKACNPEKNFVIILPIQKILLLLQHFFGAFSSAGSEHLPYKLKETVVNTQYQGQLQEFVVAFFVWFRM